MEKMGVHSKCNSFIYIQNPLKPYNLGKQVLEQWVTAGFVMSQGNDLIYFQYGCIYFYCIFQIDKIYNSSAFSHVCCLQISTSTISLFSTDHPQYIRHP